MLDVVEAAANRLEAGQEVAPEIFSQAADFFRNFTDACHHAKEEELLFPLLENHGVPREGGPVGVMLLEHEQGRAYVRGLAQAAERYASGEGAAAQVLVQNSRGYVALLRQHIFKEDRVLFNLADDLLSPAENDDLVKRFDQVEAERMGPGVHEHYHDLIAELKQVVAGWG
jgi:hemerythrin-like domain-containing protein